MCAKDLSQFTNGDFERTDPSFGKYIDFPNTEARSPYTLSKHYFVELLAKGKALGIHRKQEYATFSKLLRKFCGKQNLEMKLSIRQVRKDFWLLIARKATDPKPKNMLASGFREHGRRVWYAAQLENGKTVEVDCEQEARKARSAWMQYIGKDKRGNREGVIEPKGKKYGVFIRTT